MVLSMSPNIPKNEKEIMEMAFNSGDFKRVFEKQDRAGGQLSAKSLQEV